MERLSLRCKSRKYGDRTRNVFTLLMRESPNTNTGIGGFKDFLKLIDALHETMDPCGINCRWPETGLHFLRVMLGREEVIHNISRVIR